MEFESKDDPALHNTQETYHRAEGTYRLRKRKAPDYGFNKCADENSIIPDIDDDFYSDSLSKKTSRKKKKGVN